MPQSIDSNLIFITKADTPAEAQAVRLLMESLQSFGGELSQSRFWVFAPMGQAEYFQSIAPSHIEIFRLSVPEHIMDYPFGTKVMACACAEIQASTTVHTLVWMDADCLILQPPLLYDLGEDFDAAVRPVHLRNVGLPPSERIDPFWQGIYDALGIKDVHRTVTSFIDAIPLRAYFNSHGFSVNPKSGIFRRWYECFEKLVLDAHYQTNACKERPHQIFLFQALLSALIASSIQPQRVRILPPTYNYPYHLQAQIDEQKRATVLNDLVSMTYEGRDLDPRFVTDIEINEPLRSWLEKRVRLK